MATNRPRKLFVNLAVKDPKRSMEFFTRLGFSFNPQFTGDQAACMIVSEEAFVMLLSHEHFKQFTKKEICDTSRAVEGLFTISAESRAEVDALVNTAIAAGGTTPDSPQDRGFMYDWSFEDLDGHGWGVMWMDPAALQRDEGGK